MLRRGLCATSGSSPDAVKGGGRSSLMDLVYTKNRNKAVKQPVASPPISAAVVTNDVNARLRAKDFGVGVYKNWNDNNPLPYRTWRV
jgi:hypothetical protein